MTIWYILGSFGTLFPVLVTCTKKNLATLARNTVVGKDNFSFNFGKKLSVESFFSPSMALQMKKFRFSPSELILKDRPLVSFIHDVSHLRSSVRFLELCTFELLKAIKEIKAKVLRAQNFSVFLQLKII
jgi:hypothetical protein